MSITLITYNGQTVSPQADAILHDSVQKNGIFRGCEVTYTGSNGLHVSAGFGIIKGRQFEVSDTDLGLSMPKSGTVRGRVYIHMDLGAEEPVKILTATAAVLPALVTDEDCNYTQGIYDMELATFTATVAAIESVVQTSKMIPSSGASGSQREITLAASGWSSETVTIDGTAYYKQTITCSRIYSETPIICIGAAGTLPTEEEQTDYARISAAIADTAANTLTFYAKTKPTGTVVIIAKEVD